MGSGTPIRPVEHTATSAAAEAEQRGGLLGGRVRVLRSPAGPVQALAPPELSTTALDLAVREDLARTTWTGAALHAVGGEDAGGGARSAVRR